MSAVPRAVSAYLAEIGAKGGAVKSEAKTAAARQNAKKAGRPKGSKDSTPRVRRWKAKPGEGE